MRIFGIKRGVNVRQMRLFFAGKMYFKKIKVRVSDGILFEKSN